MRMLLEHRAELRGVPGQEQAGRVLRLGEQRVERERIVRDEPLGPRHDDHLERVELEDGLGDEGGEVGQRAGDGVGATGLDKAGGSAEARDGMD